MFSFSEYVVILDNSPHFALTATESSTMDRCMINTAKIIYSVGQDYFDNGKRWQCPSGSMARYVYLYFENPTSETCPIEVEVYTPSSSVESSKCDKVYIDVNSDTCSDDDSVDINSRSTYKHNTHIHTDTWSFISRHFASCSMNMYTSVRVLWNGEFVSITWPSKLLQKHISKFILFPLFAHSCCSGNGESMLCVTCFYF